MWTCREKVDLDLVQVTIAPGAREDAVHLRPGCTGRIGKLVIVQRSGDGLKVAEGVHDLVVGGGSIRCLAKAPRFHQDGIQVLGGARITFHDLKISCGRRDERLINANLFINQGGRSRLPPRDVVCEDCTFGAWAAHTVSVQHSLALRRDRLDALRGALPAAHARRGRRRQRPARVGQPRPAVRARQADARARAAHGRVRRAAPAARALPRPAGRDARRGAGAAARDAEGRAPRLDAHEAERPLPARPAPVDRRARPPALRLAARAVPSGSASGRGWCCAAGARASW